MAAALAKVLRGGRSGASSALIPAICRRGLQEVVAGSSPASDAAGMSRLMHTAQWRNSLPQQKALPFGSRGVLSQQQKLVRMEQFGGKRSFFDGPPDGLPWPVLGISCVLSTAYVLALLVKDIRKRKAIDDNYGALLEKIRKKYKEDDDYSISPVDDKQT